MNTIEDFNKSSISESIRILAKNINVSIDDIDKKHILYYHYHYILAQNEKYNSYIISILDTITKPSILIPNTIGSFLFGKYQKYFGSIPRECSQIFIDSIKNKNFKKCEWQVWIHTDVNNLKQLENVNSQFGYLIVNKKFSGLNDYEINKLINSGLKELNILLFSNGTYTILYDNYKLVKPEKYNFLYDNLDKIQLLPTKNKEKDSKYYNFYYLIILLILIFILFFIKRR